MNYQVSAQFNKEEVREIIETALNTTNVSVSIDSLYINEDLENKFPIMIDNSIRPYIDHLSSIKADNKEIAFRDPEYFGARPNQNYLFFNRVKIGKHNSFIEYVKLDKDKTKHKIYEISLKKNKNKWEVVEKKIIHKSPYMSTHIGMIIYRYIQFLEERRNKKPEKTDLEIEKELLEKNKN